MLLLLLFRLNIQSYHLTVELLQLVCLFGGTFDGLQRTFHSVQPVLAVRLLKHNLTEKWDKPTFSEEFVEARKLHTTKKQVAKQ